jgi:hypothetical protein
MMQGFRPEINGLVKPENARESPGMPIQGCSVLLVAPAALSEG